jgi:hypothetical protein
MGRRFGKTKADGSVEIEPNECVLTGRFVNPDNSVSVRVKDTTYFFRIVGGQADRMTDELRAQWEGEAKAEFEPVINTGYRSAFESAPVELILPGADVPSEARRRSKSLGEGE